MANIHELTIQKGLPYLLMFVGLIGMLASLVLTYDKIQVIQNPDYNPSCNINPIFSCGSVMVTEQASLMGIPNTIFGVVGFSMLFTFGFLVAGGVKVKRWIWIVAQIVATLGFVYTFYLFFQSVFRIKAICPWCFVVWMIMIPLFLYITLFNLREKIIKVPEWLNTTSNFAQKHHINILVTLYGILLAILAHQFWYYWSTLI